MLISLMKQLGVKLPSVATVRIGDAMGDTTPTIKYNLENNIYSSTVVLDNMGAIVNTQEYYPFGETSFGSYGKKRYQYVGKERDEESGLYYYGARYFSPWIARFISCDPLSAKYAQLSPYNYSDNNPINDFDIDGMQNNNSEGSEQGGNEMGPQPESQINESVLPEINGVIGPWSNEYIDSQNQDKSENESVALEETNTITEPSIGERLITMIEGLDKAPDGYISPEVFKSPGLKPTYENATKYANCEGNCYMTSIARVNELYQQNYEVAPINIIFNSNGTVTTKDYQLASTQYGAINHPFYGYGVGGVLASKGYGKVVDDNKIWTDMLPGAQIQLWNSEVGWGGHSTIFKEYGNDEFGKHFITIDNSGKEKKYYQNDNGFYYKLRRITYSKAKVVNLK